MTSADVVLTKEDMDRVWLLTAAKLAALHEKTPNLALNLLDRESKLAFGRSLMEVAMIMEPFRKEVPDVRCTLPGGPVWVTFEPLPDKKYKVRW